MMQDSSSLPPLSMSEKQISQYNTTGDGVELPQLAGESEEEDLDVLQKHVLRVQEAVLNSSDIKIKEISSQLRHTEHMLKITQEEKADTGVELYRTRKEIGHLNKILSKSKMEQERRVNEQEITEQQAGVIHRALKESTLRNNDLLNQLKEVQRKYEESQIKIKQLRDINGNYTSEVKIQKRINSKLKKEMEVVSEKAKVLTINLDKEKEKNETLFNNNKILDDLLNQQQAEVRAAKMAIETLHKENNILEKTRDATEKQWEDSLIAMSGRDKAIQSMQDHKETILTKLSETEVANRVYKAEQNNMAARLSKKEQECDELAHSNANLRTEVRALQNKLNENQHLLNQSHLAEASFTQEIDRLTKTIENKDKDIEGKSIVIGRLKDGVKQANMDANQVEKFQIPIEEAERREDRIQEESNHTIAKIKRDAESDLVSLRYELAKLKSDMAKKENELFDLKKLYDCLKEQNADLNKNYITLHESAKEMTYSIERKDHDLNVANAKSFELERDHKESFEIILTGVQSELQVAKSEKDRLKNLWLESQKALVGEQAKSKQQTAEIEMLKTKLGIAEGVKQKTGTDMKNIKDESFEHKQEAAKLYNELRKLQPLIADLQEQNKILELKLHESNLKLQESDINHTTTKQMMRTEIRRLSQERSHLRQDKSEYDKSIMHIERNTQLYKEMIDRLKSDKYELQKSVFLLKKRADDSDRKYFDLKIKVRQIEKSKEAVEAKKQAQNGLKDSKWQSFTTQDSFAMVPPSNDSQYDLDDQQQQTIKSAADKVIQDVPDFDALRLKLDSLSKEKEFLVHENGNLDSKLVKLNLRLEEMTTNFKEAKAQLKDLSQLRGEQIERIGVLDQRYNRAKKVAAHMERQIKELKPNTKIDYLMVGNPEPSTQLLAALMAKDVKNSNQLGRVVGGGGGGESFIMPPPGQYSRRATMIATQQPSSNKLSLSK